MMLPPPAKAMGLDALEEQVLVALVQAASLAAERSNAVVRGAGLSPSQYNVLRILRHAGPDGLACTEIGARMVTKDSDLTRILSGLSGMGAISSRRAREDRRRKVNLITEVGVALLQELDPMVHEEVTASLGHIEASRLRELLALLKKVGGRTNR